MKQLKVAKSSEFSELKPIFVDLEGSRIAVYRFRGEYYAYANQCPHQAGPACEGIVVGNNEAEVLDGGEVREVHFWRQHEYRVPLARRRIRPRIWRLSSKSQIPVRDLIRSSQRATRS